MKKLQLDEAEHKRQLDRFLNLRSGLEYLRFAGVVVNTLVWESGYPHDSQSELSRYLESVFASGARASAIRASKRPLPPVWIQAAGTSVGSVWSGPYLDADRNGAMEFSGSDEKLPTGRWTRELAFLGSRTSEGKLGSLTAGLKVRFSIQWREPHVRDVVLAEEPTFAMNLRLFRQLDPTGKTAASDELVEIARTMGNTTRLYKSLGSGVYETTLDVTLPSDGVYAIRVNGAATNTDLPQSARLSAELRPRLFVELLDPKQAASGIPVFVDYAVRNSGVGIPADSPVAITVGAGMYSLTGVGPGVTLGQKPDLIAPDAILLGGKTVTGTGVSAGYVGGVAASALSAGVRTSDMARAIGLKPGSLLVLPSQWIQSLRPKAVRSGQDR
jgi:hypothetical protein